MTYSPAMRLARFTFGLLTIWCLGCGAFDSFLQLSGSSAEASCMTSNDAPPSGRDAGTLRADAIPSPDGCGCMHCVGVEPAPPSLAVAPQPTPETFAEILGGPLSESREPLVPPPQARSIG